MSSLIQIHQDYLQILAAIEDNEGQLTEQLEIDLVKNLIESQDKVSGYCLVLDKYTNEIAFMKDQIKKAKEYIDRLERQQSKLEIIALEVIKSKGTKLEGTGGRYLSTRKSTKLDIYDDSLVPPIYSKIEIKLDNAAIKEALKKGEDVPGACLYENTNLSWK